MKLRDIKVGDCLYHKNIGMYVKIISIHSGKVWYKTRYNNKYEGSISNIDNQNLKYWVFDEI